jgi:hypothetical protein
MSDALALPAPAPAYQGVPTPGSTRATTRSFEPRLAGSYRRDGLDTNAALRRLRERRGEPAPGQQALPAQIETVPQYALPLDPSLRQTQSAPAQAWQPAPVPPAAMADPLVDLQIAGAHHRVPQSELIRGYLRGVDYTQKTQQLAEQVRQATQARQTFEMWRAQIEQRLPALLTAGAARFEQPIDWQKIARDDPLGYAKLDAEFKEYQKQKADAQALLQIRANEDFQNKQQVRAWGNEWLNARLEGWRDPGTRALIQNAIITYLAQEEGYSPDEIRNLEVLDPRQIVMADKARRYTVMTRADPNLERNLAARPAAPGIVHTMQGNGLLQRGPQIGGANERWTQLRDDPRASGGARREAAVAAIAERRRNPPPALR